MTGLRIFDSQYQFLCKLIYPSGSPGRRPLSCNPQAKSWCSERGTDSAGISRQPESLWGEHVVVLGSAALSVNFTMKSTHTHTNVFFLLSGLFCFICRCLSTIAQILLFVWTQTSPGRKAAIAVSVLTAFCMLPWIIFLLTPLVDSLNDFRADEDAEAVAGDKHCPCLCDETAYRLSGVGHLTFHHTPIHSVDTAHAAANNHISDQHPPHNDTHSDHNVLRQRHRHQHQQQLDRCRHPDRRFHTHVCTHPDHKSLEAGNRTSHE